MVTIDTRHDSEILKSIGFKLEYLISLCSLQGLGKRLVNVCVLFSDFTFNARPMAPECCVSGRQCIQAHLADLGVKLFFFYYLEGVRKLFFKFLHDCC